MIDEWGTAGVCLLFPLFVLKLLNMAPASPSQQLIRILFFTGVLVMLYTSTRGQAGQLDITRVQGMPNLPSPYVMRDWKDVSIKYDQLVYNTNATGQYFPLVTFKATGTNYPEVSPIQMQTYVGSASANQAEAINIIPSLVGATLSGINKSDQDGINWVVKAKDFFNLKNNEQVYLNGYSTFSGGDWWYDVMPNVFFYQLYTQYPTESGFDQQFISVADRWLQAVKAMGGSTTPWSVPNMDYRAWNLATMTGNANGVKEPEASGAIGWLLYHAYLETGDKKYRDGAQMALSFLSNYPTNPSYELQLPYGTFAAARMNAELGTSYDITKLINWCFDRGPLRGWGVINGIWNGSDVYGLIGEANDTGNDYAFIMNGFQQAAALVPLVKYDKRFARDIGKWVLNLANASRLFYAEYLPATSQDDHAWSIQYDPESVIAYEALKEKNNYDNNIPLYGTGDAKRNNWAETNLGLYGSSHVGYLGGLVETTDVAGILKLDINKTDFFGQHTYSSFLIYNPHDVSSEITLSLGALSYDIYDAISETLIKTNVTGDITMEILAGEPLVLTYLPAGSTLTDNNGKLYLDDEVIDHFYGYDYTPSLRIKSLDSEAKTLEFNQQIPFYNAVENQTGSTAYEWFINGVLSSTTADSFIWTAPEVEGVYKVLLRVSDDVSIVKDSLYVTVVERIPKPPVINKIESNKKWYETGAESTVTITATNEHPGELQYKWTLPDDVVIVQSEPAITFDVPLAEGIYTVRCEVINEDNLTTSTDIHVLVKVPTADTKPFAYYPMDGNVLDYSGNERNATLVQATVVNDSRGNAHSAYKFMASGDLIYVDNDANLNFTDKITLSFWLKLEGLSRESFVLSHGSWEERWKVSVIPGGELRWTVKTANETFDLDSTFPLVLDKFYHFTVTYTGYAMEIYVDGVLDNFAALSGAINTTGKALTMGQKALGETEYFLRGVLDEVRIYNSILGPNEILTLKDSRNSVTTGTKEHKLNLHVYPNPFKNEFSISGAEYLADYSIQVLDTYGREIPYTLTSLHGVTRISFNGLNSQVLILKIQSGDRFFYKKIISE